MELEGLTGDVGLERIEAVGQRGQRVSHGRVVEGKACWIIPASCRKAAAS
jgi:hypothetical protein